MDIFGLTKALKFSSLKHSSFHHLLSLTCSSIVFQFVVMLGKSVQNRSKLLDSTRLAKMKRSI